ncbi:MAG TPA: amidohydrolase family protein [bacterium]|nr:amidohydrolase family protein [bacterium]
MMPKKIRNVFTASLLLGLFVFLLSPASARSGGRRSPQFKIMNAHEHIQSLQEVPKFLEAMDRNDIMTTVILGSSESTFVMGRKRFKKWEENNLEILKIAKAYPGRFIAFPTLDVEDPGKLEKLKSYLNMGGRGLKLYSGNTFFHTRPLDDPSMMPVYEYCEKNGVPILFHVNPGYFQKEFELVLKQFPGLKVICPHYCLSTIKSERFEYLMETYPGLYTDTSFGYMDFLTAAIKRFSKNPEKFRNLATKYQDRILFGTDVVVTNESAKTVDWLTQVVRVYRDMLEKKTYTFFALPGETFNGLNLDPKILRKIYRDNYIRFFYGGSEPPDSK